MLELQKTLADLISINSVNSYYEGGPGEHEVERYVCDFFRLHGIDVRTQVAIEESERDPRARRNVIAVLPGRDRSRRLILEAHMDTVSVKGMLIAPFEPKVEQGVMFGRGSCDTKAGLAAMMHALVELKQEGQVPPVDVMLAAVVDEECSFKGVQKLCLDIRNEHSGEHSASTKEIVRSRTVGAIVSEPTELKIVVASKGVLRFRIKVKGKAAHSAKWHLGSNAINYMARIVLALEQDHMQLQTREYPLLGAASCNVGVIHGGVQVNFVPDECVVEVDRRLLPTETAEEVMVGYQSLIDSVTEQASGVGVGIVVELEPPVLVDPAWAVPLDSGIVGAAKEAAQSLGMDSMEAGVPFGSDASKLGRAGVPTIIFGPGNIDQAHAEIEFVELEQVFGARDFYKRCILSFT